MLHARNHVQPHKLIGRLLPHLLGDALVVVHRVHRRNRRVRPPVVQNQLSAARLKGLQIRIAGIQRASQLVIGHLQFVLRIEVQKVLIGIVHQELRVELRSESALRGFPKTAARDPGARYSWARSSGG